MHRDLEIPQDHLTRNALALLINSNSGAGQVFAVRAERHA
jgi:hypothetical protein